MNHFVAHTEHKNGKIENTKDAAEESFFLPSPKSSLWVRLLRLDFLCFRKPISLSRIVPFGESLYNKIDFNKNKNSIPFFTLYKFNYTHTLHERRLRHDVFASETLFDSCSKRTTGETLEISKTNNVEVAVVKRRNRAHSNSERVSFGLRESD